MKRNLISGIKILIILLLFYIGGCSVKYIQYSNNEKNVDNYKKALELYKKDRLSESIKYFKKIRKDNKLYPVALMNLVKISYKTGDYENTEKSLIKFKNDLVLYPYLKDFYYYYLFKTYYRKRMYRRILENEYLIDFIHENKIKNEVKIILGESYYSEEMYSEAKKIFLNLLNEKIGFYSKKNVINNLIALSENISVFNNDNFKYLKDVSYFYSEKVKKYLKKYSYMDKRIWWEIWYKTADYRETLNKRNYKNGYAILKYSSLIKNKNRRKNYLSIKIKENVYFKDKILLEYLKLNKKFPVFTENKELFLKKDKKRLFWIFFRHFLYEREYGKLNNLIDKFIADDLNFSKHELSKINFWKGYLYKKYIKKDNYKKYFLNSIKLNPLSYYHIATLKHLETDFNTTASEINIFNSKTNLTKDSHIKIIIGKLDKVNDLENIYFIQKFVSDDFLNSNYKYFFDLYKSNKEYRKVIINSFYLYRKYKFSKEILKYIYPIGYGNVIEMINHKFPEIDKPLIYALIHQESMFDYEAESHAGACGLIQIMPATAREISRKVKLKEEFDLFNPHFNLHMGIYYLNSLVDIFENEIYALASYNAGPHRVKKWLKLFGDRSVEEFIELVPFYETKNYLKLIYKKRFFYRKRLNLN